MDINIIKYGSVIYNACEHIQLTTLHEGYGKQEVSKSFTKE